MAVGSEPGSPEVAVGGGLVAVKVTVRVGVSVPNSSSKIGKPAPNAMPQITTSTAIAPMAIQNQAGRLGFIAV